MLGVRSGVLCAVCAGMVWLVAAGEAGAGDPPRQRQRLRDYSGLAPQRPAAGLLSRKPTTPASGKPAAKRRADRAGEIIVNRRLSGLVAGGHPSQHFVVNAWRVGADLRPEPIGGSVRLTLRRRSSGAVLFERTVSAKDLAASWQTGLLARGHLVKVAWTAAEAQAIGDDWTATVAPVGGGRITEVVPAKTVAVPVVPAEVRPARAAAVVVPVAASRAVAESVDPFADDTDDAEGGNVFPAVPEFEPETVAEEPAASEAEAESDAAGWEPLVTGAASDTGWEPLVVGEVETFAEPGAEIEWDDEGDEDDEKAAGLSAAMRVLVVGESSLALESPAPAPEVEAVEPAAAEIEPAAAEVEETTDVDAAYASDRTRSLLAGHRAASRDRGGLPSVGLPAMRPLTLADVEARAQGGPPAIRPRMGSRAGASGVADGLPVLPRTAALAEPEDRSIAIPIGPLVDPSLTRRGLSANARRALRLDEGGEAAALRVPRLPAIDRTISSPEEVVPTRDPFGGASGTGVRLPAMKGRGVVRPMPGPGMPGPSAALPVIRPGEAAVRVGPRKPAASAVTRGTVQHVGYLEPEEPPLPAGYRGPVITPLGRER